MKLSVKVKARAKQNLVVMKSGDSAVVSVTSPALKGQANEAVIKLLAAYFHKPKSHIILVRGEKSREKIFEVCN